MTVGTLVAFVVLAIIGGAIAGLITKSPVVAIGFPILLIVFYLMKRNLDNNRGEEDEVKEEDSKSGEETPPVSNQ